MDVHPSSSTHNGPTVDGHDPSSHPKGRGGGTRSLRAEVTNGRSRIHKAFRPDPEDGSRNRRHEIFYTVPPTHFCPWSRLRAPVSPPDPQQSSSFFGGYTLTVSHTPPSLSFPVTLD